MRLFRRRCPWTPLGKCPVTDAFFRSGPAGTGISEKSTRNSTRRKRPHVGRQQRSQKPVATAAEVAATYDKTLPANSANSGRRWRLSPPNTNARCAPPKELPSEVRPFWRRARSILVRVRSVLEGVAAVGEPRLTGEGSCRGVLS